MLAAMLLTPIWSLKDGSGKFVCVCVPAHTRDLIFFLSHQMPQSKIPAPGDFIPKSN